MIVLTIQESLLEVELFDRLPHGLVPDVHFRHLPAVSVKSIDAPLREKCLFALMLALLRILQEDSLTSLPTLTKVSDTFDIPGHNDLPFLGIHL